MKAKKISKKRWRLVCDKHYQLTCTPAGVTAKLKHIGGVFVALVPFCPIITINISVMALVIFNKLQSCGNRKGYILVQNYILDLLAPRGVLGLIFAGYVPLASKSPSLPHCCLFCGQSQTPSESLLGKYVIFAIPTQSLSIFFELSYIHDMFFIWTLTINSISTISKYLKLQTTKIPNHMWLISY